MDGVVLIVDVSSRAVLILGRRRFFLFNTQSSVQCDIRLDCAGTLIPLYIKRYDTM